MSSTNKTTNYELPQFISTDKPTWLGDFNGAMGTIDTTMKANEAAAAAAAATANAAAPATDLAVTDGKVGILEGKVATLENDIVKLRCYAGQYTTGTVSGDSTQTVTVTLPNTYKEILAVIPYGYDPSSSWGTRIVFDAATVAGSLRFRVVGSTNQYYTIRYWVLYSVE